MIGAGAFARRWLVVALALTALAPAVPRAADPGPVRSERRGWPGELERWTPGLKLLHASRTESALAWFDARRRERPEDICTRYFPALVYANFDVDALASDDRARRSRELVKDGIGLGQDLVDGGSADVASRYCLGALHGLRAADRLDRSKYMGAALDAKRSRRIMLDLLADQPDCNDCRFWVGAYDYFADVLPALIRFFRSLLFFPTGDRQRGLTNLWDVADRGTLDRFNALWVLYRIYSGPESDPRRAREALERIRAVYPDCIDASIALAWHHARREVPPRRERSVTLHLAALERASGIDGAPRGPLARRVGISLARAYLDDLRPGDAVATLRPLMPSLRGRAEQETAATSVLIRALNLAGSHEEAVAELGRWKARHPESPRREALEGQTYEFDADTARVYSAATAAWRTGRQGNLAGAAASFRGLLERHAARGLIRYAMAEMYFEAQRDDEAELHYRAAVEAGIVGPTRLLPMAYLRIGNLLDLRGDRGGARSSYRRASSAARDHPAMRRAAKKLLKEPYRRPAPTAAP